jgi:hypothetical protein
MHSLRERVGRPLVDALAADLDSHGNRCMDFGWHAQYELVGLWLLWGSAELFARL